MKKIIALIFSAIVCCSTANASKAWPHAMYFNQPDGTTLTVFLHGDENFHWYASADGAVLYRQGDKFYIAQTTADGTLTPTGLLAHNPELRTPDEAAAILSQDRESFIYHGYAQAQAKATATSLYGTNYFPHIGQPRIAVVLVQFQGYGFTMDNPRKSFQQYFNGEGEPEDYGYREDMNYGSVRQYFIDQSDSLFMPQFDIYGPVTLPHGMTYYGGRNSNNGNDEKVSALAYDACRLMADSIDLDKYSNQETGRVDLIYFVYAGYGQNTGGADSTIWAKVSTLNTRLDDSHTLVRGGFSPELLGPYSDTTIHRINGVGVTCHEFSHALGLPDFYPTGVSTVNDNQGMEDWSLMDNGEYVANGHVPTAYTAWEREAMGWMTIDTLTDARQVTMENIDYGGKAYKIISNDNPDEYWIVQYVQNRKWNQRLAGHRATSADMIVDGLLMYHVDYNRNYFSLSSNSVNSTIGHPRMAVVPADGLLMSSYRINDGIHTQEQYNQQLAGDIFSTGDSITIGQADELPNYKAWTGSTDKPIYDISVDGDNNRLTFSFLKHFAATGISQTLYDEAPTVKAIYSIDGHRLNTLGKGVNIVVLSNGRVIKRVKN